MNTVCNYAEGIHFAVLYIELAMGPGVSHEAFNAETRVSD